MGAPGFVSSVSSLSGKSIGDLHRPRIFESQVKVSVEN